MIRMLISVVYVNWLTGCVGAWQMAFRCLTPTGFISFPGFVHHSCCRYLIISDMACDASDAERGWGQGMCLSDAWSSFTRLLSTYLNYHRLVVRWSGRCTSCIRPKRVEHQRVSSMMWSSSSTYYRVMKRLTTLGRSLLIGETVDVES